MAAWGRLDENQRARLDNDPKLASKVIGDMVSLDSAQTYVLNRYCELRDAASADQGISVPETEDPIVAAHLRAMDRAYFAVRSEAIAAERESIRATRH